MKLFVLRDEDDSPYDVSPELEGLSASAESSLQQRGYIRVHRAVMDACGAMPALLYGILENLIQIGEQTGMGCVPSHRALSAALGTSIATVKVHLNTLREAGWIAWEGTDSGGVNRYWLPVQKGVARIQPPPARKPLPLARIQPPPSQNLANPQPESSYNLERVNKQERVRVNDPPSGPPNNPPRRKPRTALDAHWRPSPEQVQAAHERGWTLERVERELAKFRNYHESQGTLSASWAASWRTWVDKGLEFDASGGTKGGYKSQADLNQGGRGVAMW